MGPRAGSPVRAVKSRSDGVRLSGAGGTPSATAWGGGGRLLVADAIAGGMRGTIMIMIMVYMITGQVMTRMAGRRYNSSQR